MEEPFLTDFKKTDFHFGCSFRKQACSLICSFKVSSSFCCKMFAAAAHALADIVDDKQEGAAVLTILAKEAHEDVE